MTRVIGNRYFFRRVHEGPSPRALGAAQPWACLQQPFFLCMKITLTEYDDIPGKGPMGTSDQIQALILCMNYNAEFFILTKELE